MNLFLEIIRPVFHVLLVYLHVVPSLYNKYHLYIPNLRTTLIYLS